MLLNRERALGVMADFGIDALLATTPVNLLYVSDYAPWHHWVYRLFTATKFMFQNYALLPRRTDVAPALIFMHYIYQAQWPSWIENLYPFGPAPEFEGEPGPEYGPEVQR